MARAGRRRTGGKGRATGRLAVLAQRFGLSTAPGSRGKPTRAPRRLVWIVVVFALGLLAGAFGVHALIDDKPSRPEAATAPAAEYAPTVDADEPDIGDLIAA
jgi:hypothetical protein